MKDARLAGTTISMSDIEHFMNELKSTAARIEAKTKSLYDRLGPIICTPPLVLVASLADECRPESRRPQSEFAGRLDEINALLRVAEFTVDSSLDYLAL